MMTSALQSQKDSNHEKIINVDLEQSRIFSKNNSQNIEITILFLDTIIQNAITTKNSSTEYDFEENWHDAAKNLKEWQDFSN
jgi:hypothetical protein